MIFLNKMVSPVVIVRSPLRKTLPQIIAITVKNILLFGYGMTMGFPTILIPHLAQPNLFEAVYLTEEDISWIGSIAMLCIPVGCILSGILTPMIGRKKSMQFMCTPFLICGVIMKYSESTWQIYLALGLIGIAAGFLEAPVITYVAEITQPHLRGILSATGSLAVLLGNLVVFIVGTFNEWRIVAIYCGIPSTVAFCLLHFIPESPQWLIAQHRHDDAKRNLAWLRGWVTLPEVEEEFQELLVAQKQKHLEDEVEKKHCFANYTTRGFARPLILISFMLFLSHFTGMTTLQTYSVYIFQTFRSPINNYYTTILLGVSQFCGALFCAGAIRFLGKRVLMFLSLGVASACFITVATYAYVIGIKQLLTRAPNAQEFQYTWIPMSGLLVGAFALQGGARAIPWVVMGEMYSRKTRAMGSGISGAISYVFGFLTNKLFLQAVRVLTLPGIFWFYSSVGILGLGMLYLWLPETEGKTLQEISEHFEGGCKLDNKIKKTSSLHDCEQAVSRL